MGVRLYQPQKGYCYNSDSLFLYDFASRFSLRGKVLDVGAGCGIVGLLLARDFPNISLEAVEKQEKFVEYAKKNAKENGIEYTIYMQDFLSMPEQTRYDYILSNPPFYHDGVQKSKDEMLFHARYNVHLPIEPFFKKVAKMLSARGFFIFCYDASQLPLVASALEKAKLRMLNVRFVHPKREKKASLVLIRARKESKSMTEVQTPLFVFEGDSFTPEVEKIYAKAATESIKCEL